MGRSYRSQSKTVREEFLLIQGKFGGSRRNNLSAEAQAGMAIFHNYTE